MADGIVKPSWSSTGGFWRGGRSGTRSCRYQALHRALAPNFPHESRDGEKPLPRLDDTGVRAARWFVDAIHMAVTPPTLPWAQLAWTDPALDRVWEYRVSRQESEGTVQESFNQSNFQREIGRFWYGYPTAGTSCLYLEDLNNAGRLRFEAYSVNAVSLAEGAEGGSTRWGGSTRGREGDRGAVAGGAGGPGDPAGDRRETGGHAVPDFALDRTER
jgi:hypothetical protein